MSAPVKNTCPDIDRAIKKLDCIQRIAKDGMKRFDRLSDEHQMFKDIEWDIDEIIQTFENLRKANAALREWGEQLETEVE